MNSSSLLKIAALALSVGALSIQATHAAPIVLTFEGLQDQESVNNFYNGGTGSLGSSGTNYGISFTSDSLALISAADGGSGNFANNPSGDTILFFVTGAGDTMNVAAGFTTGFSFFYADQVGFTGSVNVYSGLNGTGSLLASLSLPSTPNPYTVWDPVGVSFSGTAESAVFGGSADFIGFDDITLGSSNAGGSVPDSGGMSLYILAGGLLAGFGMMQRRKQVA